MFRPQRGHDQSRIRMPRQTLAPGLKDLQAVYEQAKENRGREVELTWQVPHSAKAYSIHVKFDRVTPQPLWNIWENNGKDAKLVWRFETADVNMIYDVVAMLDVSHSGGTPTQQMTQPNANPRATGSFTIPTNLGSAISGTYAAGGAQNPATAPGANNMNTGSYSRQQPQTAPIQPTFQVPPDPPRAQAGGGSWKPAEATAQTGNWATDLLNSPAGQPMTQPATQQRPANPLPQPVQKMGQTNPGFAQQPTSAFNQSQTQGRGLGAIAPSSLPEGSLPADFFSDAPATMAAPPTNKATTIEGTIEQTPMNSVLTGIGMQQLTGKLEIIGDSAVGHVYFENGIPKDAQTSGSRGDDAIKELVTWRRGTFVFKSGVRTEMSSVEKSLQTSVQEGIALLDQLKHLEKSGLVYESILGQKQKNLGDPELKLMLAKGVPLEFPIQKEAYESLKHKKTFTDFLRDKPMEQAQWAPLLFNLLYCGLIEIKAPTTARGGALDFLGEHKQIVQALAFNFIRPDTGMMSWESMLYFMEYEYYRYEAYSWPMSLVVFEMALRRGGQGLQETEPLPAQALNTAAQRIGLVKRPLDLLGHFESRDFAILMPNTRASQAAFVANRILDSLTVTPLSPGIDRANLSLCFGVANLPADGEDLESLISAASSAKSEASKGNFPIVLARTGKRD